MLCIVNEYYLADETIPGGFALTDLRLKIQRIFDVVIPLGESDPVLLDRNKRRAEISFTVSRVHASIKDAETFIADHNATIPRTGDIKLISSPTTIFATPTSALIVNGAVLQHELIQQIGKFTQHTYRIVGSLLFAPTPGEDHLVTEGGDRITTEGGDALIVE